jgi:hypothetical protein
VDHFWIEAVGYGGTACTIASYSMRTIIPLRIAGILSSVFFISYGVLIQSWPMLAMELVILPLNLTRLFQVLRLLKQVDAAAATNELSTDWLKPFGRARRYKAGETVFHAGDTADYLLVLSSGRFELSEAGIGLEIGQIVGELGFLSPGNRRTMTLKCVQDGTVSRISYGDLKQLYYSNPKFAFYFLRLISDRLFQNLERAEREKLAA